jgi:hypothetical protein
MVSDTAPGLRRAPRPGTTPMPPAPGPAQASDRPHTPGLAQTSHAPAPAQTHTPGRAVHAPEPVQTHTPGQAWHAPEPAQTHTPGRAVHAPEPVQTAHAAGPMRVPGLAHAPTAAPSAPTVPAHMLPHRTPAQLLTIARQGLAEAAQTRPEGLRYAAAHLAALRAAAAVHAARARPAAPSSRRSRVTSVWTLLALVAPDFSDWAGYFALGAGKRAAAEAGIPRVVSSREADDLLRAAEQFVAVVESSLGLSYQPPLDQAAFTTSPSGARAA